MLSQTALSDETSLSASDASLKMLAYWQIAFGSILTSFSAVFVRLSHTGPTVDGFYRMLFGGVTLLLIAFYKRSSLWAGWKSFFFLSISGIFLASDLIFWHRSIGIIGPGLATVIGNFQVFVLAFVGVALYKEQVNWKFYAAIPVVFIGMYCLVGFKWEYLSPHYRLGIYQALVTAIFYGLCVITLRTSQSLPRKLDAIPNLALLSLVSCVYLALIANFQNESFAIPDMQNGFWLVCYGLFGQAFGWLLISKALPKIDISIAGFFILLQPSLSFVWDIAIFHRPTPGIEILGALITLFAIYLSLIGKQAKKA